MKYEIHAFDPSDPPDGIGELIAISQQPEVQMLALTAADLATHVRSWGAFVPNRSGKLVGYIAETRNYRAGTIVEMGALVVHREYRNNGIARALINIATAETLKYSDVQPIAFCNGLSTSLFLAEEYGLAKNGCIPNEAYDFCADCRKKPTHKKCCDLVLYYPSHENEDEPHE